MIALGAAATARGNPFPGLRPFDAGEEHLFFGREPHVDDLLRRLRRHRFLAVVGTSGSGKSSLVRAGMLPALHGGFMAGTGSRWRVAVMRPGSAPVANLAAALAEPNVLGTADGNRDLQTGLAQAVLERGELGLVELVQQSRLAPGENVLVLVDQFEELFRFAAVGSTEDGLAFVKLLLAAAAQPEIPIYVVLTMRSDFLGDCARFRRLPEAINDGLFLVPRMTRDQVRRAIEGPVGVGGATIAPRLVTRLLNELGDDPDQLPVLQHALMRTWDLWRAEERAADPIDVRHLDAAGGLREALSRHADEVFAELANDRQRLVAEKLFKALTELGTDNRGTRRPTRFMALCAIIGCLPGELGRVIEAFRAPGRSFVMPPAGVPLHDETVVDISHESLMRAWTRLHGWADDEASAAEMYRRIAEVGALHARGRAALWRNPDLALGVAWREKQRPTAAWAERIAGHFETAMAFLAASEAADAAERAARRRRLRLSALVVAVFFVVALVLLLIAWNAQRRSERAQLASEQAQRQEAIAAQAAVAARNAAHDEKVAATKAAGVAAQRLTAAQRHDELQQALKAYNAGVALSGAAPDYPRAVGFFTQAIAALERGGGFGTRVNLVDAYYGRAVAEDRGAQALRRAGRDAAATGMAQHAAADYRHVLALAASVPGAVALANGARLGLRLLASARGEPPAASRLEPARRFAHDRAAAASVAASRREAAATRPASDACTRSLRFELIAANDAIARSAAYAAANRGLAANAACGDAQLRLVTEAYLYSMRGPAAFGTGLSGWKADLDRADAALRRCMQTPGLRGTRAATDCGTQIRFNDVARRRIGLAVLRTPDAPLQ